MLIDRLVLRFSEPAGGIEIRNTRTGKVVGKVSAQVTASVVTVVLTEPVRSDRRAVSGAGATAVTLVAAHGVTPAEIPVVGGFTPTSPMN